MVDSPIVGLGSQTDQPICNIQDACLQVKAGEEKNKKKQKDLRKIK